MTKITDKPVHEATSNGDGTFSGVKLVQWLFEVSTGKSMTDKEAMMLIEEAQKKAQHAKQLVGISKT